LAVENEAAEDDPVEEEAVGRVERVDSRKSRKAESAVTGESTFVGKSCPSTVVEYKGR